MLSRVTRFLLAVATWGVCLVDATCGEQPFVKPDKISNAALIYWQAFSFLPALDDDQAAVIAEIETGDRPIAEAEKLLSRAAMALRLANLVTPQTPCRWDLIEDGPATLIPHASKARLLARLMVLQARFDASQGKTAATMSGLTSALLVARNVDEGVLIQLLVANAIEDLVLDAAEELLPEFNAEQCRQWGASLAQLPQRTTFAVAIRYERDVFGRWLEPLVAGDPQEALQILRQIPQGALLLAGDKQQRQQRYDQFLAAYDAIIRTARLPAAEAEKEFTRIEAQYEKSANPLVKTLMPAVGGAYRKSQQTATRFDTLRQELSK